MIAQREFSGPEARSLTAPTLTTYTTSDLQGCRKCLIYVRNIHSNAKNGTNVHLWSCNNNSGSNWEFIDDVYWLEGRIRLIGTNLCLSKSGTDSASNGDNIHLYDCNSGKSANNTWSWEAGVDKMKLKGTNQCLQKKGADSASNGDNLHLWDCNTGATGNKEWYGYFR